MTRPLVVVGAGIVGLATAYRVLERYPGRPLIVLEKEDHVAAHQTGHNSGVIHSGIYYRPGSLKAVLCRTGRALLIDYLKDHQIPYRLSGKVIVATTASELERLSELGRRARENGIPGARMIEPGELRRLEPEAAGIAALHIPGTGIVDYTAVARSLAEEVVRRGGEIRTGERVQRIDPGPDGLRVTVGDQVIDAEYLVNAAGLQADRIAALSGIDPPCRIVPFRGEYYTLAPTARSLVRGLIYPVPDPALPFLGVHLTPRIDGSVEAGPNAVLALAREGYRKTDLDVAELAGTILYRGFLGLARQYWRTSIHEAERSLSKRVFLEDLRRLVPRLSAADLSPGGAGVRAQALSPTGTLADDFLLVEGPRALHILNAPSPAATSSLAIADYLIARIPGLGG